MGKKLRKKNALAKLWLKLSNRKKYKQYKVERWAYGLKNYSTTHNVLDPDHIKAIASRNQSLHLLHNGNAGDIIYALPTIRELRQVSGVPVRLYLNLDQRHDIPSHHTHPLGNVMLNRQMAGMLTPLLAGQPYLEECGIYERQRIDIDLNEFRNSGILLDRGSIARWYNHVTGLHPDLSEKWIDVRPNGQFARHVVVARSSRYRNPYIDYSFLSKYDNILFLGVEPEYEDIKKQIPHISWVKVSDFLEMAAIIAGCRFFIGNQSFPFALAEGLKVNRILENSVEVPNVIPEGGRSYDFYFQSHFEWIVKYWNDKL